MKPGTFVLLHSPLDRAAAWGGVPETLRSYGLDVVTPDIPTIRGAAYVARAALIIAATAPMTPLVLVGHGQAGPLLPLIGVAQRAAHRLVGGYVFIDARLPASCGANGRLNGRLLQGVSGGPNSGSSPGAAGGTVGGRSVAPVHDLVPDPPADWPDAPCGFLATVAAYDQQARLAWLRGWSIARSDPVSGLAQAVHKLVVTL